MGCDRIGPNTWVCSSATGLWARIVKRCNSCRRGRRHVVEDHEWYGEIVTCCACGLQRGEAAPRLQNKKDRCAAAARARIRWPHATDQETYFQRVIARHKETT